MEQQFHFFIGKGGVGKSTISAVTSVHLSNADRNTLLASMDPAHNQRDIFRMDFSKTPKEIGRHLAVMEIDESYWVEKYLKETQEQIKKTYRYESAFNLENYFDVLKFSPGVEEYALLLAFENIIGSFSDKEIIVFDMAPTALTLRFFSMPAVSLIWLEELLRLRKKIYEKKEIVSKIKVGKKEIEKDTVTSKLERLIQNHQNLKKLFMSKTSIVNLVMNNDPLSLSESVRIKKRLADVGIQLDRVVLNKVVNTGIGEDIEKEFEGQKIIRLPFSSKGLIGYRAIDEYVNANRENLMGFIS